MVAPHLGGYIEGGDPATFYPKLWTWLVRDYGVSSVLDVGCGEGQAVEFFADLLNDPLGMEVVGIDGVPPAAPNLVQHDFCDGPYLDLAGRFDLVWSSEFVEHVEEEYVPNFLGTFALGDLVLMTHADPGQIGHHHVNCQPSAYWIEHLAGIGYDLDKDLTTTTRALAAENKDPLNHYVRSGLAFRRYP